MSAASRSRDRRPRVALLAMFALAGAPGLSQSLADPLASAHDPVAPLAQPEHRPLPPGLDPSPTKLWTLRLSPGATAESLAEAFEGIRTFTRPGRDAEIGFQLPTQITGIAVAGDAKVAEGDLIILGDDREDVEMVRLQKLRAETDLPIQRASAQVRIAQTEFEEINNAFENGAATPQQLNRAEASLDVARIDLQTARLNQQQEEIGLRRMQERLERLRLKAPFDGRVAEILVDIGDSVQENRPVVRVVSLNPLRIDVHTPIEDIERLGISKDDTAWAYIARPGQPMLAIGTVLEVSPAADFSTRKRRVRVEIPNPHEIPSGLPAWVRFTEPPAAMLDGATPIDAPTEPRAPEAADAAPVEG